MVKPTHVTEMVREHHHRDVRGGAARAAVFGISDGLVSNISLIMGVAGAHPSSNAVRLAGLALLIGGSFSMASGEYISMRAQTELLERELAMERIEIGRRPELERRELAQIYQSRGIDADVADDLATQVHRDPELALETHAREELGIDPSELGSPRAAAVSSFLTFSAGALAPLLPWFVIHGTAAMLTSVTIAFVASIAVGVALARFTGRSSLQTAARQVLFTAVPALVTWLIGNAMGAAGVA